MSNKKQTAVDWFSEQTCNIFNLFQEGLISMKDFRNKMISFEDQAKAMEKEQIETAHQNGFYCGNDICNATNPEFQSAEQYYKNTYE